ncbi:alpha-L-arabinofuranosidase [Athalassotoga saccharophila]|uniref:alpha-L-arabinofuranosidase n=1 Tax=Athalassotoga saccharophila TaxID=1441386 RepID=UPI00137A7206|nr:alpha-L-arabinofuranosidase [Athalassotoga saccharophila]BBJ28992.1 intracellular exo-alpha-(1->5)-L-arabinofuranosidase [Athalassotoga saccharophila]
MSKYFVFLALMTFAVFGLANVSVTINTAAEIVTLPQTAFGLNVAAWDWHLLDSVIPGLLENLNVKVLRFPGGSFSDMYDWKTNSTVPGQNFPYVDPQNTFDNFMKLVNQIGAQALITVNYGTNFAGTAGGDPQEAAAWVKYANIDHNYDVKYWEIGNEVYGNGTYGANWEVDLHSTKGPQAYADNFIAFAKAMKAVDPSIKIGAVLTCPYNWPWGQSPDWNKVVLQTARDYIDFVVVHWYAQNPGNESDSGLLASTNQIPDMLARLKQEIRDYAGPNADRIRIFVTETNSVSYNPGKQTTSLVNALFLVNDYMNWLTGGVDNVDWWTLHNNGLTGNNNSDKLYGNTNYGDYGILSNNTNFGTSDVEPPNNTPFPTYFGYEILKYLAGPNDTVVGSVSDQNLVDVYAVKHTNGDLAIMIVNTDPKNSYDVNLNILGFRPSDDAIEYVYGMGNGIGGAMESIMSKTIELSSPIKVAPYSINVIVMKPQHVAKIVGPQVMQDTTISSTTLTPGQVERIETIFANKFGNISNGVVEMEIYNSSGKMVGQKTIPDVSIGANGSYKVDWNWTVPNAPDIYTVKSFLFDRSMTNLFSSSNEAAHFTVAIPPAPSFSITGNVKPAELGVGENGVISVTVTNVSDLGYLNNGIIDVEIHNAVNQKVWQQFEQNINLSPSQSITLTYDFTLPSSGTYSLQVGVFSGGWGTNYAWNSDVAKIVVK